jgi:hypothetical protein
VAPEAIMQWIDRLALERLEIKVRRSEGRLRQLIDEDRGKVEEPFRRYYGSPEDIPPPRDSHTRRDFADKRFWEQLLYEGVMEALGYSKNRSSFLALARSARLDFLRRHGLDDPATTMAILFGVAGLLPPAREIPDREARAYAGMLRSRWRTIRPSFKGPALNAGDWQFFRLRPSNFPTARLAAVCYILPNLFGDGMFRELVSLFKETDPAGAEVPRHLRSFFTSEPDSFWRCHCRFGPPTAGRVVGLGPSRVNGIIINVIVPLMLLYARVFGDHAIRQHAKDLPAFLHGAERNGITRQLERELVRGKLPVDSAGRQQGLIQLFRFYCSAGRCAECAIGRIVF